MPRIEVPEELLPGEELQVEAKAIDESYKKLYDELLKMPGEYRPTDIIDLIASVRVGHVSLMIGAKLTDYDKKVLHGLIERYVAGIVFNG